MSSPEPSRQIARAWGRMSYSGFQAARSFRRMTRCSTPTRRAMSKATPWRKARGVHGHLGARRDEPRHPSWMYMDSVPIVAITGQVGNHKGTDAFQEADIRGITMPIQLLDHQARRHCRGNRIGIPHCRDGPPALVDITKIGEDALRVAASAGSSRLPSGDQAP